MCDCLRGVVVSCLCSLLVIWLRLDLFGGLVFGWLVILVGVLTAAGVF